MVRDGEFRRDRWGPPGAVRPTLMNINGWVHPPRTPGPKSVIDGVHAA